MKKLRQGQYIMETGHFFLLLIAADVTFGSTEENPRPVLKGPSPTWLTEGDSATLSCEVRGSTTGWRFHWYKIAPNKSELPYILHESMTYHLEMLSDSIRGSGGSYTLSPATLRHSGLYVCRAERGEPAYHTEFSQPQPLWVTGILASHVIVSPNTNQHFSSGPLSLKCEGSGTSTGWRLRWFSDCPERGICPCGLAEAGPTCSTTSSAYSFQTGIYWCQSKSGEQSNPVNITVHDGRVILESPVHPVTEGDSLTLGCIHRYQPSDFSADFYKDGTLLQTSSTGEMTIPAVSKSHEGLYKCKNQEKGESPESWVTVKASPPVPESKLATLGAVVGVVGVFLAVSTMFLLYCLKKRKGYLTAGSGTQAPQTGQQQHNTGQNVDHRLSAGNEDQHEYETLPSVNIYDNINTVQNDEDGTTVRLSDVTYAIIDQESTSGHVKNRQKKDERESVRDIVYSELKAAQLTGDTDDRTTDD